MTKPPGLEIDGRTYWYIDARGRDISFPRWRVYMYYESHMAETVFFDAEATYNRFIQQSAPLTYADYADFRRQCGNWYD